MNSAKIYIILCAMILSSVFAEASTAPKCSAVLMFQKSEIEAQVTAIAKTIATHQMKLNHGLEGDQYAFSEATRQINEITQLYPAMIQFYISEMNRLSNKSSPIKNEIKKVAQKETVMSKKDQIQESIFYLYINNKQNTLFKKKNGSYFVIGESKEFADFMNSQEDIKQVYTNKENSAIAILKNDGSVVTWGKNDTGGNSSNVDLTNVESIVATVRVFAALKKDGSVVTWGSTIYLNLSPPKVITNVQSIFSNNYAFAALTKDGSVISWGDKNWGGDSSHLDLTDVQSIYSSGGAFAALKNNGSVIMWGHEGWGGRSSDLNLKNIRSIYTTNKSFAAVNKDGFVITWGDADYGGNLPHFTVDNVKLIVSTGSAFAALKYDGSIFTWGDRSEGGDASHVDLNNVQSIFSTRGAFAALKSDGTVVTWGSDSRGGDSYAVQNQLYDITQIIEIKSGSFIAVRKDGKYILWGQPIGEYRNEVTNFDLM